jgi:hypothetical protein
VCPRGGREASSWTSTRRLEQCCSCRTTARTDGFPAYFGLEAIGVRHDRKVQGPDRAHSTKILPWSHTVFGSLNPPCQRL